MFFKVSVVGMLYSPTKVEPLWFHFAKSSMSLSRDPEAGTTGWRLRTPDIRLETYPATAGYG